MTAKQTNIDQYRANLYQFPWMSREKATASGLLQFIEDMYAETTITLYVNGATGNDNYKGLAAAKPKATQQGAVDALPNDYRTAYIVVAAGTYDENVIIVKPHTGTLYFCGAAATATATDTLGAACYDSTPAASVTGFHQITMAGMFTVANATEAAWVRITWAAGDYEWAKVLGRVSDDVAELGISLPAGKVDADYDTLAISLIQPGTITNPTSGAAYTIYDAPGGSAGSVVFGMMKIVGDTYGVRVMGKAGGIYSVLSSITADGAGSTGLSMEEKAEVAVGHLPAFPTAFSTLMGIGTQAAVPREGAYLEGGAAGYGFNVLDGDLYLGTVYCKSAIAGSGGRITLAGAGQAFESTTDLSGDCYMQPTANTVPTRVENTITTSEFAKFKYGILDGAVGATANLLTMAGKSYGVIGGTSGLNQAHASAWLQMSQSAELVIDGTTVASALPAQLAVSILDCAKLYVTDLTMPDQDYGAVAIISADGPGVYLKITAAACKNTNGGNIQCVDVLKGANYHIVNLANVALLANDNNRYALVGAAGKTDINGYGAGTFLNDLPVAPAGTESLSKLFVEA